MAAGNDDREIRKRTRRSFLVAAGSAVAAVFGWSWLNSREEDGELPWPFRRVLEFNGRLWHGIFRPGREERAPAPPPRGKKPRVNGDIGLGSRVDPASWRLRVESAPNYPGVRPLELKLRDLAWLPKTERTGDFKCIEGWSEVMSFGGIRFTDFMAGIGVGTRSGRKFHPGDGLDDLYRYVGLETPDGEYYVSLDMESMLHPGTMLATDMNGEPLTPEHGAPLRLVVPVKYGIKSLKRIGRIFFSDTRPPDYWAEQGYDWYSGL